MTNYKRERMRVKDTASAFNFYTATKEVQNCGDRSIGMREMNDRRFHDYFGVPVVISFLVWNNAVCGHLPVDGTISYFLWALHFAKVYPAQDEGNAATRGSGGAIETKT